MAKTIDQLIKVFTGIYYLEDTSIIPLICAAVLSNRMPGDAVWLMLVGGSGSGKTELINAVTDLKFVFQLSTLTSNTLLSGMKVKGKESSLLLRIPKTSVLVMKDFTTILSMGKEDQQEIMAQLREVYDGKMHKSTGNGEDVKWEGKVNLIAGVTEKIFVMEHKFSGGGLRTINYCLPEPDYKGRIATTKRSAKIASGIKEYREHIKREFTEFIELMIPKLAGFNSEVDEALSDELVGLSEFVALARSPVERDFNGRIHMKLAPEMPMRLSNQLHLLAKALMVMSGGILPPEYKKILYKIALDSIPKGRRMVLKTLASAEYGNTKGIATSLNYPTDTVRPWLEDLNAFGIVMREEGKGRSGDRWSLANQYKDMMSIYDNIAKNGGVLEEFDEEDGATPETKVETDWGDFVN